jgi:glycosyltransferase involved in cell wall biosynthesis
VAQNKEKMFYSIIVPVYNRPEETEELLNSLLLQSSQNFELVLVEDGSTLPANEVAEKYSSRLHIKYLTKPNTGRSDSRNVGMHNASGNYFVFFDSDCIIPPHYFDCLNKQLHENYSDCFGGPDAAHESFTRLQKAINYAMTSFFTTGGIRGGKQQMEKFKPRTFNMGFSREVFEKVGGFNDMFGEDIDLSIRIDKAGFRTALYREVFVYHKRRVSFKKFFRQIYHFGVGRINLSILHKGSLKMVHAFPSLFLVGAVAVIILSLVLTPWCWLFPAVYLAVLFADALRKTKDVATAGLAVWASVLQIVAYGWGFLQSALQKVMLRRGLESTETLKRIYH